MLRWVLIAGMAACHATPSVAAPASPGPPAAAPDRRATMRSDACQVPISPEAQSARDYEEGVLLLEEAVAGEAFDADVFEAAMRRLRSAAQAGNLPAQSLYGRTMLEVLLPTGPPRAYQREDYVSALSYLRIAALRDDPDARAFLPGLTDPFPPTEAPLLNALPSAWVQEAWHRADTWLAYRAL